MIEEGKTHGINFAGKQYLGNSLISPHYLMHPIAYTISIYKIYKRMEKSKENIKMKMKLEALYVAWEVQVNPPGLWMVDGSGSMLV